MYAYCWASCLIKFGAEVPDGAIKIAQGYEHMLLVIEVCANSYTNGKNEKIYSIPGINDSDTEEKKLEALLRFRKTVDTCLFELHAL